MAVWALSRLTAVTQFQALMQEYLPAELDETVQAEWAEAYTAYVPFENA